MNTTKATVFRLTFTQLTEPTEVTVNGEIVGTWTPAEAPRWAEIVRNDGVMREEEIRTGEIAPPRPDETITRVRPGRRKPVDLTKRA